MRSAISSVKLSTCSATTIVMPRVLFDLVERVGDILDDRRLDALCRLIEQQHLGLETNVRAWASCCRCPPEALPPAGGASHEHGKERIDRGIDPPSAGRGEAGANIFLDRQRGEI